jgi:hypothetical protein
MLARRFTFRRLYAEDAFAVGGAVSRLPSDAPRVALVVAVADTHAPIATIDAERPDRAAVLGAGRSGAPTRSDSREIAAQVAPRFSRGWSASRWRR